MPNRRSSSQLPYYAAVNLFFNNPEAGQRAVERVIRERPTLTARDLVMVTTVIGQWDAVSPTWPTGIDDTHDTLLQLYEEAVLNVIEGLERKECTDNEAKVRVVEAFLAAYSRLPYRCNWAPPEEQARRMAADWFEEMWEKKGRIEIHLLAMNPEEGDVHEARHALFANLVRIFISQDGPLGPEWEGEEERILAGRAHLRTLFRTILARCYPYVCNPLVHNNWDRSAPNAYVESLVKALVILGAPAEHVVSIGVADSIGNELPLPDPIVLDAYLRQPGADIRDDVLIPLRKRYVREACREVIDDFKFSYEERTLTPWGNRENLFANVRDAYVPVRDNMRVAHRITLYLDDEEAGDRDIRAAVQEWYDDRYEIATGDDDEEGEGDVDDELLAHYETGRRHVLDTYEAAEGPAEGATQDEEAMQDD